MKLLDLTFSSPWHNVACDEALLLYCEATKCESLLRFWQPQDYFVVMGLSNKIHHEVNIQACTVHQIPIIRRASGGGTIVNGPGCLNYTLVLDINLHESLHQINETYRWVLQRNRSFLNQLFTDEVEMKGICDLAMNQLKFSGNAQRRKKSYILFHGTFLLNFDLPMIMKLLPMPSQQPDYRLNRSHQDFLANLNLSPQVIMQEMSKEWQATEEFTDIPFDLIDELVINKYQTEEWTYKF
ncbi:MAG: lipoate--protein ligase family protein [bacterium]|jgi:lipoate-protein ligase A